MNKYKEKLGNILNKVKGNKRVLYFTFCTILILFCLALNVTFAKYITNTSKQGTNITIGNMSYIFAVNSEFEDLKSDIYNDRVIRLKAGLTQRYYVSITAQNKYASKYELNYRVCASYDEKTNTCTYADSLPDGVRIAHADGYWSGTKWVVNANSATENTICYAKFITTTTPIPNFQYLVNETDVSSNSAYVKTINDGDGNWRI